MRILTCYLPPTEGHGAGGRPRRLRRAHGGEEARRLHPGDPASLHGHDRGYLPGLLRQDQGVPSPQRRARLDSAVEKCRIGDVRKTLIGRLSKGYRQRVWPGPGHPARPRGAHPGRAHAGSTPSRSSRPATSSRGWAASTPSSSLPTSSRGVHDLRARGHHQQGQGGRGRHAGELTTACAARGPCASRARDAAALAEALRAVPGVVAVRAHPPAGPASLIDVEAAAGADVRAELARAAVHRARPARAPAVA